MSQSIDTSSTKPATTTKGDQPQVTILNGAFTVHHEGKERTAKCKYCDSTFKYHHSTSSLSYHLKAKHPFTSTTTDYSGTSQQSLSTTWEERKMTPSHQNDITNGLVRWIARNARPVNI